MTIVRLNVTRAAADHAAGKHLPKTLMAALEGLPDGSHLANADNDPAV